MRSTRLRALLCALVILIVQLGSKQVIGQDRTSASSAAPSLPRALSDGTPSPKRGPYLAQKRARILALQAEEKRLGNGSPELLPMIYELAAWYEKWGTNGEARPLYRRAVQIIEAAYGSDDLRLVEPLTRIASTYERDHKYSAEGRKALERIVGLYAATDSVAEQSDAVIALGDWHLLSDEPDEAISAYTQAWSMLVAMSGGSSALAVGKLGRPFRVQYSFEDAPASPGSTSLQDLADPTGSYTVVKFTVTPNGSVDDVFVAETTTPASMTHVVRVAASSARYRPAFEDGRPVASQVTLVHRFAGDSAP